jgi:hypothetical protein
MMSIFDLESRAGMLASQLAVRDRVSPSRQLVRRSPVDQTTNANGAGQLQPPAANANEPLPEETRRRVVVEVLATAVTDLLLAEVEAAARGGHDELSTS